MSGKNIGTALAVTCIFHALCFSAPAEELSAKEFYEEAFRAILSDDYDEAYDRLNEIIARYPGTIYAQLAQARRRQLENLNLSSNYDSEKGHFSERAYSINDTPRRMGRSALSDVYHSKYIGYLPLIGSSF